MKISSECARGDCTNCHTKKCTCMHHGEIDLMKSGLAIERREQIRAEYEAVSNKPDMSNDYAYYLANKDKPKFKYGPWHIWWSRRVG